jgi:hypothetical protein
MACITPATGQATAQYYLIQDDCGELPVSPEWTKVRRTSGVPTVTREALESGELDGTAERKDVRLGNFAVNAEFAVEMIAGDHDDLLAAALQSDWVAGSTVAGLTVTVNAAAKTITRDSGSFITDGVVVGSLIRFPGLTGYNAQPQQVTAVTATVVTLGAARAASTLLGVDGLVNATSVTTSLVIGDSLKVGVTRKKLALLTVYNDLETGTPHYDVAIDCEVTAYSYTVGVNSIATGSFTVIGKHFSDDTTLPAGSTFAADSTQRPFSGIEGNLSVGAGLVGFVSSLDMSIDRNATANYELGSKYLSHVGYGILSNTLTANTSLYQGNPLKAAFFNETYLDLACRMVDGAKGMMFRFPRVKVTSAPPQVQEGDITIAAEMTAVRDSAVGSSLVIWRL